ncbi:uncharacterized protein LOC113561657 [Ooceraea biroi]|uniref:uncharacterized protein LOC113561657 n=1 Tax=Ooceraea biroi TaxID=2015173 RepID=UPI000F07DFA9|nr:uncharacterized protein LOC113561657 [Ooceraea biroi]
MIKPDAVPTIFNSSLKANYNIHDTNEEMQPQNTCNENENIIIEASSTYCEEERAESICKESIPETTTQGTTIMGHLSNKSTQKKHRQNIQRIRSKLNKLITFKNQ